MKGYNQHLLKTYRDTKEINALEKMAKKYRKGFLAAPIERFQNLELVDFCEVIMEFYYTFVFFPDKEIITKFRAIGFNSYFLRWFTNMSDILKLFEEIEKSGKIKIHRSKAINVIDVIFEIKIMHEIYQWTNQVVTHDGQKETSALFLRTYNAYRQRHTTTKKQRQFTDEKSMSIHKAIDRVEKLVPDKEFAEKLFKDMSRGKSSIFLDMLIRDAICNDRPLSKRTFYIALFDLIKLITKDEFKLLTEDEFEKLDRNYSYDTYKYRRVQQIFEKK